MSEEFSNFLDQTREKPIREKVDALSEILEKMMMIIMSIPESVDKVISDLSLRISNIDNRINGIENKIANLKASPTPTVASPSGPSPPLPPGAPPPPPGAPSRPGTPPKPARPANPTSLRTSIMGELKDLFKKRKQLSE
ncbi:MAG: hypothetical protein ACTSWY_00870 [Promethearchaeota archaeon]